MEVEKILDAGSGILSDVMTAVETNQYQDLGRKISDRVQDVTDGITGSSRNASGFSGAVNRDDTVYTGTVENTNKKDGIYRTNYNSGAYSSDAYRHYSSERRNGPVTPNSSSRARSAGNAYSGNPNRAGYDHVYGQGEQGYANYTARQSSAKGAYGKYDYRNPDRQANLGKAGSAASNTTQGPQPRAGQGAGARGAYGRYDPRNPENNRNTAAYDAARKPGREFFAP
ncbi:MAG: hypothetical protein J5842_07350, partial [Lachnospiraceae bacterium]|nr:hypothetical protein [Lachnospiraceae bacterium]